MKSSSSLAVYHPLLVAMMHEREEFRRAQQGWSQQAERDRQLASVMSLDTFIGPTVVHELGKLGVSETECEAVRNSAEWIEHGAHDVLRGGVVYDLSGRLDALRHPRPARAALLAWKCPYKALYLHWGEGPALKSPFSGVLVEGCYVQPGSAGPPTEALEDLYFLTAVCGFRNPSNRLELPLVQEYRRYARALPFLIEAHDEPGTPLDAPAHRFLDNGESCFRSLWGELAIPVIEAAIAAVGFAIDSSSLPIETLAVMMDGEEPDYDFLAAVREENLEALWEDYGAVLVKRF